LARGRGHALKEVFAETWDNFTGGGKAKGEEKNGILLDVKGERGPSRIRKKKVSYHPREEKEEQ